MKKIAPSTIVIFVFCLVFSVGFFALIYPSLSPIGKKLAIIETYGSVPFDAGSTLSLNSRQEEQRSLLAQESVKVQKLLPQESNLYDLSIQLEALGKVAGVATTSVSLTPGAGTASAPTKSSQATAALQTAPAGTEKSSIAISVVGSYQAVQAYLDGLTSLERYIEVQDVSISAQQANISMTITASAYSVAKVAPAAPKPAQAGGKDE